MMEAVTFERLLIFLTLLVHQLLILRSPQRQGCHRTAYKHNKYPVYKHNLELLSLQILRQRQQHNR